MKQWFAELGLAPAARGRLRGEGRSLPLGDARIAPVGLAAAVCALAGYLITQHGTLPTLLIVGVVVAVSTPVLVQVLNRGWLVPIWLVGGVAAYPFLRYPRVSGVVVTFDRVWILSGLVLLLVRKVAAPRVAATKFMLWSLVSLVVLFGLRAAFNESNSTSAVSVWIEAILVPFGLFLLARQAAGSNQLVMRVLGAMMIAGAVVAGLGIAEHYVGFEMATLTGGTPRFDVSIGTTRVSGPYPVPEIYALVLLMSLAATMMWLQIRREFVLGGLAVAVITVGIVLSYFRSAWIGGALIIVGSLGIRRYRYGRMFAVFTLTLAIGYVAFTQLETESSTFSARVNDTTNISGRFATYKTAFNLFKTAPVFGVGINQYTNAVNKVFPASVSGVQAVPFPHSSYLGILAEQGIVGFAALIAATIAAVGVVRALGRRARAPADVLLVTTMAVAGLGYLIMSLTLTMLPYGPSNGFFMVLLGLAAGRVDKLEPE